MNCESARDSIILAAYGELPDEQVIGLEQHLMACDECMAELAAMQQMDKLVALHPMAEPDPNMVAQARMRLDEALDAIPHGGFLARLRADALAWMGHLTGAPALATLLVGVGFLAGNFTYRYQVANAPKLPGVVVLSNTGGGISNISGIAKLPNEMVQVSYNRSSPEVAEGSLDDPQIRRLLMVATNSADNNLVRTEAVELIANECRIGHGCVTESDGSGIQSGGSAAGAGWPDTLREPGRTGSGCRGAGVADGRERAGADEGVYDAEAGGFRRERAAGAADGVGAGR